MKRGNQIVVYLATAFLGIAVPCFLWPSRNANHHPSRHGHKLRLHMQSGRAATPETSFAATETCLPTNKSRLWRMIPIFAAYPWNGNRNTANACSTFPVFLRRRN